MPEKKSDEDREARLKKALRDNLRRRKAAARRSGSEAETGKPSDGPETGKP